jgi:hypothetical protein
METSDDDDEYLGTGGKLGSQKQEAWESLQNLAQVKAEQYCTCVLQSDWCHPSF